MTLFFQALDARGWPSRPCAAPPTLNQAKPSAALAATSRATRPPQPNRSSLRCGSLRGLRPGPEGSWPLRFDRLIQPVLDQHCVSCHAPGAKDAQAAQFDLTPAKSYDSLVRYGKPSLARADSAWLSPGLLQTGRRPGRDQRPSRAPVRSRRPLPGQARRQRPGTLHRLDGHLRATARLLQCRPGAPPGRIAPRLRRPLNRCRPPGSCRGGRTSCPDRFGGKSELILSGLV